MEIYVITDTHGLRAVYEDQMIPKFTKLYVGCESEASTNSWNLVMKVTLD